MKNYEKFEDKMSRADYDNLNRLVKRLELQKLIEEVKKKDSNQTSGIGNRAERNAEVLGYKRAQTDFITLLKNEIKKFEN